MIEHIYFDLNIKARNWHILGYLAGALESLLEKLANIEVSGWGEVAPRINRRRDHLCGTATPEHRGGQAMAQEPDPVAYVKAWVKWT